MQIQRLTILLVIVLSGWVSADQLTGVTVERIMIRSERYDALVRFSESFANPCEDSGYWAKLNVTDKPESQLAWSALMTAYVAKTKVTVVTKADCSYHNYIESITLE